MANTFVGAVVNMGMKKLVQIVGDQVINYTLSS